MLNSIPASGVSFKGAEIPEEKKQLTAADIKQKTDEFTSGLDAASEGIKEATDSVTGAVATVGGATTMVGGALSKIIPKPVKDFFAPVLKNGDEILKDPETGKVLRKMDWKKMGIAGAILAGTITLAIGISHICKRHKAKQAEAVQQEKYPDNFVKSEEQKTAEVEE